MWGHPFSLKTERGRAALHPFSNAPSSWVSEESLSSVGMSSLSLKSSEGEFTGARISIFSPMMLSIASAFSRAPSPSSPSSSKGRPSNWVETEKSRGSQGPGLGALTLTAGADFPRTVQGSALLLPSRSTASPRMAALAPRPQVRSRAAPPLWCNNASLPPARTWFSKRLKGFISIFYSFSH